MGRAGSTLSAAGYTILDVTLVSHPHAECNGNSAILKKIVIFSAVGGAEATDRYPHVARQMISNLQRGVVKAMQQSQGDPLAESET